MTLNEKKVINDYLRGELTKEAFLKNYPVDLRKNKNYVLINLQKAYSNKNIENVEYALSLLYFDNDAFTTNKYVEVLNNLMHEEWHYSHEDIAALLQGIKSPQSINVLYETALKTFDYLSYDDTYALARKCIHALKDIGTQEAIDKLKLLAKSGIPIIQEKAKKQLNDLHDL